jgi:hypothetical protein
MLDNAALKKRKTDPASRPEGAEVRLIARSGMSKRRSEAGRLHPEFLGARQREPVACCSRSKPFLVLCFWGSNCPGCDHHGRLKMKPHGGPHRALWLSPRQRSWVDRLAITTKLEIEHRQGLAPPLRRSAERLAGANAVAQANVYSS